MRTLAGVILGALLAALIGVVAFVAGYLATARWLKLRPVNRAWRQAAGGTRIWVLSNGVHVDLVLPVRKGDVDWSAWFDREHLRGPWEGQAWVSVGWGDRGFWLDTPTWGELKPSTAFRALFGLGPSVLHVKYMHRSALSEGERCRSLLLRDDEYARLVGFIRAQFVLRGGRPVPIPGAHYGDDDAFYESHGRYNFFETCNTWANRGLKVAGVKTATWAPFHAAVLWHLPRPSDDGEV